MKYLKIFLLCALFFISPLNAMQQKKNFNKKQPKSLCLAIPMDDNERDIQNDRILNKAEHLITEGYNQRPIEASMLPHLRRMAPEKINAFVTTLQDPNMQLYWPYFILLEGKSGVGKTTYAKFISQTIGWPYIFIRSSTIADEYQHSGAANLGRIFEKVFKLAKERPHIIIFDEIDSIASNGEKYHNIDKGTIEEFAMCLYQCEQKKRLVVIGTTSNLSNQNKKILSHCMLNIISLKFPKNLQYTKDILKYYLSLHSYNCSEQFLEQFAKKASDLTPAFLEHVVSKSIRIANMGGNNAVTPKDLQRALEQHRATQQLFKKPFRKNVFKFIKKYGTSCLIFIQFSIIAYLACLQFKPVIPIPKFQITKH